MADQIGQHTGAGTEGRLLRRLHNSGGKVVSLNP